MKVKLDRDEWWPVWTIDDNYGTEYEVPDDVAAELRRTQAAFEDAQDKIRAIVERSK